MTAAVRTSSSVPLPPLSFAARRLHVGELAAVANEYREALREHGLRSDRQTRRRLAIARAKLHDLLDVHLPLVADLLVAAKESRP